jgi:hypothetical protein
MDDIQRVGVAATLVVILSLSSLHDGIVDRRGGW